jgi:hypothetical protein
MIIHQGYTCDVTDDENDKVLVTLHDNTDHTISVHTCKGYDQFSFNMRLEQARNLRDKLTDVLADIDHLIGIEDDPLSNSLP